jgi:hypothetical protein
MDAGSAAIRARTMTSAGMADVDVGLAIPLDPPIQQSTWNWTLDESFVVEGDQNGLGPQWKRLMDDFRIDLKFIRQANTYLLSNTKNIAEDNLKSQCSRGHSCKESAKKLLRKAIKNLS